MAFGAGLAGFGYLFSQAASCTVNGSAAPTSACASFGSIFVDAGVVLIVLGAALSVVKLLRGDTGYFLTSYRLLQTRNGTIVKQLSRSVFKGRQVGQYMTSWSPYMVNNIPMFIVQVLDPATGNLAMKLGGLENEAVQQLEAIADTVYCAYCGQKNQASSTKCSECGASL